MTEETPEEPVTDYYNVLRTVQRRLASALDPSNLAETQIRGALEVLEYVRKCLAIEPLGELQQEAFDDLSESAQKLANRLRARGAISFSEVSREDSYELLRSDLFYRHEGAWYLRSEEDFEVIF